MLIVLCIVVFDVVVGVNDLLVAARTVNALDVVVAIWVVVVDVVVVVIDISVFFLVVVIVILDVVIDANWRASVVNGISIGRIMSFRRFC